jgi:hypothetical protein
MQSILNNAILRLFKELTQDRRRCTLDGYSQVSNYNDLVSISRQSHVRFVTGILALRLWFFEYFGVSCCPFSFGSTRSSLCPGFITYPIIMALQPFVGPWSLFSVRKWTVESWVTAQVVRRPRKLGNAGMESLAIPEKLWLWRPRPPGFKSMQHKSTDVSE